jgi:hypothetical protein
MVITWLTPVAIAIPQGNGLPEPIATVVPIEVFGIDEIECGSDVKSCTSPAEQQKAIGIDQAICALATASVRSGCRSIELGPAQPRDRRRRCVIDGAAAHPVLRLYL